MTDEQSPGGPVMCLVFPAIAGGVGMVVASTGTWAYADEAWSFQWYVDRLAVDGATSAAYELPEGASEVYVEVTAQNRDSSMTARSNTLYLGAEIEKS